LRGSEKVIAIGFEVGGFILAGAIAGAIAGWNLAVWRCRDDQRRSKEAWRQLDESLELAHELGYATRVEEERELLPSIARPGGMA